MRLTIVGGGSTYTPELIDGFIRLRDELPIEEIVLVDTDRSRLDLVGGVSRRMLARGGHPATLITTDDLVAGVTDADAVLIQLRVGGQDAREQDESWPHDVDCIGQETTGPGGLAKALRTVPIVLRIAEAVRRRVVVDGRPVVTQEVRVRPGSEGRSILDVTLTEGRNRIVRRWAEAMGLKVDRLARLSYGPVRLGDLAPGRSRPLTPREEAALYRAIGLEAEE